jgi:hypothetical protein
MTIEDDQIIVRLAPRADDPAQPQAHCLTFKALEFGSVLQQLGETAEMRQARAGHLRRNQPPRAYSAWTEQDDEDLADKVSEGWAVADLAGYFGRSKGAIWSRIERLTLGGRIPAATAAGHD